METRLDIRERLLLFHILPLEGNIVTLKIIRDLKNQLGITEEEYKAAEMKKDGETFTWNNEAVQSKEFHIGDVAAGIIKDALLSLNKDNKLKEEMISLYDKFTS